MSVSRKINDTIVESGLIQQLRDGEIFEQNTWEGSLQQVTDQFNSERENWQNANTQRRGPNILLTMERTFPAPPDYPHDRGEEETIEVIWREVMLPLRQAPGLLNGIEAEDITPGFLDVIDEDYRHGTIATTYGNDLYDEYARLLQKSVREFPSAVPVVRRTKSRQNATQNKLTLGEAYVRDTPPVTPPGTWEWLKTMDERRRDGRTYTQVEEWTGGRELSTLIYPEV